MNDFGGKGIFHAFRAEDLQEIIPREPLQQADQKLLPIEGACLPTPSHQHIVGLCGIDRIIPEERFQLSLYKDLFLGGQVRHADASECEAGMMQSREHLFDFRNRVNAEGTLLPGLSASFRIGSIVL
jgi:hypothetical protein